MAESATQAEAAIPNTEAPATTPAHEPLQPQPQDATPRDLHDQLAAQLANPDWTPEPSPAASAPASMDPQAGDPPPGPARAEAGATPAAEGDDDAAEGSERSKRFRFTDPADRRFATLRKEGIAPGEAARIAYGLGEQAGATAPAAEQTYHDGDGGSAEDRRRQKNHPGQWIRIHATAGRTCHGRRAAPGHQCHHRSTGAKGGHGPVLLRARVG